MKYKKGVDFARKKKNSFFFLYFNASLNTTVNLLTPYSDQHVISPEKIPWIKY